ncbi:hypothetical protein Kisp01_33280 [Kineosporia sp. NBRC 101677]|nr:hypothetical protein Kisp01_33280 [Kineosporia sp. NBRC 101677]
MGRRDRPPAQTAGHLRNGESVSYRIPILLAAVARHAGNARATTVLLVGSSRCLRGVGLNAPPSTGDVRFPESVGPAREGI